MSAASPGRPRRGRVERLAPEHRDRVDRELRAGRHQTEVLAAVNPELDAAGERPLSRSGLSRYARRMAAVSERVARSREAAKALVAGLDEQVGDQSLAVTHLAQALAFDLLGLIDPDGDEPDVRACAAALKDIALTNQRLARAEDSARKRMAAQAEAVEEIARSQGLSDDAVARMRAALEAT